MPSPPIWSAAAKPSPLSKHWAVPAVLFSKYTHCKSRYCRFAPSRLGLVLGALAPYGVQTFFGSILPVALVPDIYVEPLLAAAGFGVLSAAGFALWPLGKVEKVSVGSLFRQAVDARAVRPARRYLFAIGVCFAGLLALAMVIAQRTDIAVWFAVGVGLSYFALRATAWLLVKLVRLAGRPRQPEWRLAMSNITRPNAPVRAVVLSMGLSVTLLSTISMLDGNINTQISGDLPDRTPSFFFLDIQPDQIDGFTDLLAATDGVDTTEKSPMLRGQIMAVNDIAAADLSPTPDVAWVLRGDRGLTYGREAPEGGEIVEGTWWAPDYQGPPLVSFDAEIAAGLDIGIGDTVTVNVLGRPLTATIANLRKIDWASGGLNFVMVFSPEQMARAPHTYLTTVTMTPERSRSDPCPGTRLSECNDYPRQGSIGDGERHYRKYRIGRARHERGDTARRHSGSGRGHGVRPSRARV